MISGIRHAWALLGGLTLGEYFQLAEWHQWLVLGVLALLAGAGVHYVLGYVLRFYWRGGKFQWWIAILAMPMLVASVLALTGMYLLGIGAPRLADALLQAGPEGQASLTAQVGTYLLEPALAHAEKKPGALGPTRHQLEQALRAMPTEQLRQALGGDREDAPAPEASKEAPPAAPQATPPGDAPAPSNAPNAEPQMEPPPAPVTAATVILKIVRDWITEPNQAFPEETAPADTGKPAPTPTPAAKSPPTLGTYLIGLIGEVSPDAALPPADWTLIAGTRFGEHMLRPLLLEYLQRGALAGTILILLLNLGYFWTVQRMARGAKPPAAKPTAAKPDADAPPKSEATPGVMAQS
jgi:hypothetical protein